MNDIYNFENFLIKCSDHMDIKTFIAKKENYKILYED